MITPDHPGARTADVDTRAALRPSPPSSGLPPVVAGEALMLRADGRVPRPNARGAGHWVVASPRSLRRADARAQRRAARGRKGGAS